MQTIHGKHFLNQIQIIHSASMHTSNDNIQICINSMMYDE